MRKKLTIRLMWFAVITGMISFFGLFILAGNGVFGEMPEFEQLENPNTNLACLLYTSDAADDLTRVDLGGRRIIKIKFS